MPKVQNSAFLSNDNNCRSVISKKQGGGMNGEADVSSDSLRLVEGTSWPVSLRNDSISRIAPQSLTPKNDSTGAGGLRSPMMTLLLNSICQDSLLNALLIEFQGASANRKMKLQVLKLDPSQI